MRRNRRYVWGFVGLMLGIALGASGVALGRRQQPVPIEIIPALPTATAVPTGTPLPSVTPGPIRVFVSGEVVFPAVYELPAGAIVEQAVAAAGGFTALAEPVLVNLAAPLQDGMQVYIPQQGEVAAPPPLVRPAAEPGAVGSGDASGGLLDLNVATVAELESLPGIGPSTAQKIVSYREENGRFLAIEEVMDVPGIGPAKFEEIKELITVAGD